MRSHKEINGIYSPVKSTVRYIASMPGAYLRTMTFKQEGHRTFNFKKNKL